MRKRAILCREEHCAVAAEMSLLYEALPSIECKEEEEGGLSEKGGPTKASDVVGEGGREAGPAYFPRLPSFLPDAASCSRYLASSLHCERPSAHSYSPLSFLPSCLGSGPAGGTVARGSGTVVGRRGPLPSSPNERNVGRGRDGRAQGRADGGRMAESELGRGKSKLSHFKRWEWRENKNRMGRPQRGGEDKTRMTVQEPRSCRLCKMVGRNELFSP